MRNSISLPNTLKNLNEPLYIFVLKEGQSIDKDPFDYSLHLLQVGQAIIIPSPNKNFKLNSISMSSVFNK